MRKALLLLLVFMILIMEGCRKKDYVIVTDYDSFKNKSEITITVSP